MFLLFKDMVKSLFMIRSSDHFNKYLGFPIVNHKPKAVDFHLVIENIIIKILSWKSNFLLTPKGMLTLVHCTLSSIHAYSMQYFEFPTIIHHRIDKIKRDFLWGSSAHTRKKS